jgi:outer membrane lipoprotein-sorting protein
MRRIAAVISSVILSWAVLTPAFAQNPSTPGGDKKPGEGLPTAEQIIEKYVQALGGKAAIEKVTSQVSKGTFEIPNFGATGTVEIYAKAPNKQLTISNSPGFGSTVRGFDGTIGWEESPMSRRRDLKGAELALMKRDSDLQRSLKFKEFYSKLTVTGKETSEGREAYVVEAVPNEGNPEKLYFDTQTGLLVRKDVEMMSRTGKVTLNIYLENYKDVNGLKVPFTERRVSPSFSLTILLEDVKQNVPVDDAKFNKPAQSN